MTDALVTLLNRVLDNANVAYNHTLNELRTSVNALTEQVNYLLQSKGETDKVLFEYKVWAANLKSKYATQLQEAESERTSLINLIELKNKEIADLSDKIIDLKFVANSLKTENKPQTPVSLDIPTENSQKQICELIAPVSVPDSNESEIKSQISDSVEDSTKNSDKQTEDIPFKSEAFWDLMVPTTLKQNTINNYKFHLDKLHSLDEIQLLEWINVTPETYKNQRTILAARMIKHFNLNITLPSRVKSTINQNIQSNQDYENLYDEFNIYINSSTIKITKYNLFIWFIPTRRRDIFDLVICKDLPDDIETTETNYYCQSNKTFYFNTYKTSKVYGRQVLKLSDYSFVIKSRAVDWLQSQLEGKLFDECDRTIYSKIKSHTGLNLQQARHIWASYGFKNLNQEQHQMLATFMAHSYNVSSTVYRP